jgi:hypothetical protein
VSAADPDSVPKHAVEAVAPPSDPSIEKLSSLPRRGGKVKRSSAAEAAPPTTPEIVPASPPPEPVGLVTDWNW